MPELTTRAGKGSELTHNELDANFKRTVSQKTANYTCLISDNRNIIEGNHATTAFTITLPTVATAAASDTGDYEVTITNINAAVVSVDGNGAETINGSTTALEVGQWEAVTVRLNSAQTGWITGDGAPVAGHVKAGNEYLQDGGTSYGTFFTSFEVTEEAWETVGPTGSGATNIWTAMDNLPSGARILKAMAYVSLVPTASTSSVSVASYITSGAVASPSVVASNRFVLESINMNSAGSGEGVITKRAIDIPLDEDRVFKVYWDESNNSSAQSLIFYYMGFKAG